MIGAHGQPRAAMGTTCTVHRHRELVPIEVHHIQPLAMGGPDTPANKTPLCSNAHSAVHYYLALLVKGDGTVPWPTARRYGLKVRELALRGYTAWRDANRPH